MNPEGKIAIIAGAGLALAALAASEARHDRSGDGSVNRDYEMKQMAGGPAVGAGNRHERRASRARGW
jgi:hypothetical protein